MESRKLAKRELQLKTDKQLLHIVSV